LFLFTFFIIFFFPVLDKDKQKKNKKKTKKTKKMNETNKTKNKTKECKTEETKKEIKEANNTKELTKTTPLLKLEQPQLTRHHENYLITRRLVLLMTQDDPNLILTLESDMQVAYFRNAYSLPPNPIDPRQLWELRPRDASQNKWFVYHPMTGSVVTKGEEGNDTRGRTECKTFQGTANANNEYTYVTLSNADKQMTGSNYKGDQFAYGRSKPGNKLMGFAAGGENEIPNTNILWASTYYD